MQRSFRSPTHRRQFVHVSALFSLGLVGACSASPRPAPQPEQPVGMTEQAIEGGSPINVNDSHVVAPMFPIFTVGLGAPDGSGGFNGYCTGTIIAPTLVLTAAHCHVSVTRGDAVILYPVGTGKGNLPTGTTVPVTNVDVQTGVGCSSASDPTCYSTWGSGNKHYADIAVVTVAPAFTSPYQAIGIRPTASAVGSFFSDLYAVGRGYHNFVSVKCVASPSMPASVSNGNSPGAPAPSGMFWAPVAAGLFDAADSTSDTFTTNWLVGEPGDSGGPLLRYPPSASYFGLNPYLGLLGVLSTLTGCATGDEGPLGPDASNLYTNISQTDNSNWLLGLGAVTTSDFILPPEEGSIATFGAAE